MKTQFDKIYVISLTTEKARQEFIKQQFDDLGIEFEFIYGTDFGSFTKDGSGYWITYPYVYDNNTSNSPQNFGCTITHYQAVLQAYELGYKNVLIIEDDICFIKNKELIFDMLNSIPSDAYFVTWDPRFITTDIINEQELLINELSQTSSKYLHLQNHYKNLCGGMMYGLMNRYTMELYINSQRKNLNMSDRVIGIWKNPIIKRYVCSKCLCTDQYNIGQNFESAFIFYENIYHKINPLNRSLFYIPENFKYFTRFEL